MSKRELARARVLITGASSGIGRALARQLANYEARLVLTARRQQPLELLADEVAAIAPRPRLICGDITQPATRAACLDAVGELGGLELLVNNAGIGAWGTFQEADEARLRQVMEVNFFAPAELMRAAIPWLEQGDRPLIVNIGSVLGHRAVPSKSEYCASKFALHGLSDALRAEFAPRGIGVLLVSPSTTRSEFFERLLGDSAPHSGRGMTPAKVARAIIGGIERGRQEVILSWGGRLLVWVDRLCPPVANRLVARFAPRAEE